ncbi:hypothetical protein BO83DRAFT_415368 [Aspergillus eucalypticola CBS 122712]|uniref:Uncharacterized protein n=1 Tax=Aspergillus eucalypticola (strain CBS 122712 / IBT 29274) TaxID=1448314 RepID=A0A317W119_ASPEC|nr:uncharacterized protein BO83DRAFT_415368 [Aspergillus eucalypticola CBS 122712]PWY78917.1 hypothetical protein BO83DRAFT_415368 [Aspergillus eucalypticola CBS 122712]
MQYLMMRSYSLPLIPPFQFGATMRKLSFSPDLMRQADGILEKSRDWANYISVVEKEIPVARLREGESDLWPGAFMAAKRLQEQTCTVEGVHDRARRARYRKVEEFSDAEDEATPHAALLVLLQEITHMVEGTGLEWVLNKTHFVADFENGRQYNAYCDGALRRTSDLSSKLSKGMRARKSRTIITQEACEIVMKHPQSSIFKDHFLLSSQDRHQIFLTFARFRQKLFEYYKDGAYTNEFLSLKTFGPWDTENPLRLVHLAKVITSAIMIAKAALHV